MFGIEVNGIFGLIWLVILIWAVIRVAQSGADPLPKALWIVAIIVLPVIGLLAWLIFGPK